MSARTLSHSPFRPGRTRLAHRRELRVISVLVGLAYLIGVVIAACSGDAGSVSLRISVLGALGMAVVFAVVSEDNAHVVERGFLVANLPILLLIGLKGSSTGMLFYYVPVVLHVVYSERVRTARVLLVVGYCSAFAATIAYQAYGDYVPAAPPTKLLFEFQATFFAVALTGFNLRRFRRFNGAAREELREREAVLEQHGAEWREGRAALERRGVEVAEVKTASSLSIAREQVARAQIEAQAEEMRQFAYAASHDLKEPVRTIRSFVQMTRRRLPPDYELPAESAEFFDHIETSTASMGALLDRLLLYSRAERISETAADVSVERLLLRVGTDERVRVARVPEVLAGATVSVALARVEAVVGELVSNALCFSESETDVEVGLRVGGEGGVELYVADRGIGIPREYCERVFGLFQRLHAKDDYPGHGVGLALCRRLLGGDETRLRLLPREGGGTEAVLSL